MSPCLSALHLMEVLLADQTRDEEKSQDILAALSECWHAGDNVSLALEFFPVVICVNPASAFRLQGQS